jgi:hypothetical protein
VLIASEIKRKTRNGQATTRSFLCADGVCERTGMVTVVAGAFRLLLSPLEQTWETLGGWKEAGQNRSEKTGGVRCRTQMPDRLRYTAFVTRLTAITYEHDCGDAAVTLQASN